jgi:hypothetical protein
MDLLQLLARAEFKPSKSNLNASDTYISHPTALFSTIRIVFPAPLGEKVIATTFTYRKQLRRGLESPRDSWLTKQTKRSDFTGVSSAFLQ